ncbi:MAG: dihydrofolate reductase [Candidatus Magasanikbacteria bacterium]|nr:dihydrofolate reductase [Candidatus Magasanikbacteria bacterium]
MITLVAAISKNNCIGKDNAIPWDIPEDMKRMREITKGKVLIMGRKTWESIPENRRPLPQRTNVVITRDKNFPLPAGAERFDSINEAIAAHKDEEIIGFGGQRIFEEMIDIADVLDLTLVDQNIENCHAFFPEIDPKVWKISAEEKHNGFTFITYRRVL